jgi:hypothetical protein
VREGEGQPKKCDRQSEICCRRCCESCVAACTSALSSGSSRVAADNFLSSAIYLSTAIDYRRAALEELCRYLCLVCVCAVSGPMMSKQRASTA